MKKTFIGIRDVDEVTFRKFRAISIEEKIRLGKAITFAMSDYIEKQHIKKKQKNNAKELLKVKPFNWGPGTEKTSKEIDEILYGPKK